MWLHLSPSWVNYNDSLLARKFLWEIFVCWFPWTVPKDSCMTENLPFFKRPASSTSISAIFPAVTQNVIYDKHQNPSDIRGETWLRWAPARQAWSSAEIIYQKVMALFLNTNRWEREKAGTWMKSISKVTEYTQVYSVSKSPCTPINISEVHNSKQIRSQTIKKKNFKKNPVLLLSLFH